MYMIRQKYSYGYTLPREKNWGGTMQYHIASDVLVLVAVTTVTVWFYSSAPDPLSPASDANNSSGPPRGPPASLGQPEVSLDRVTGTGYNLEGFGCCGANLVVTDALQPCRWAETRGIYLRSYIVPTCSPGGIRTCPDGTFKLYLGRLGTGLCHEHPV